MTTPEPPSAPEPRAATAVELANDAISRLWDLQRLARRELFGPDRKVVQGSPILWGYGRGESPGEFTERWEFVLAVASGAREAFFDLLADHSSAAAALRAVPAPEPTVLEQWEAEAQAFCDATGYLRPGKDVPAVLATHDYELHQEIAWKAWCAGGNFASTRRAAPAPAGPPDARCYEDALRYEYPSGNWMMDVDAGIARQMAERWNSQVDENQRAILSGASPAGRDLSALVAQLRALIGKWGASMWGDGGGANRPWSRRTLERWEQVDALLDQIEGKG